MGFPDSLIGDYFVIDSMFQKDSNKIIYNGRYFPDIYKYNDSANILSINISISKYTVVMEMIGRSYYDTCKIDKSKYLNNVENYMISGKYLINEEIEKDTLADLLKKDILKCLNGTFYLNIYNAENDWETYQLVYNHESTMDVNVVDRSKLGTLPGKFKVDYTSFAVYLKNMNDKKFKYLIDNNYYVKFLKIKKYVH